MRLSTKLIDPWTTRPNRTLHHPLLDSQDASQAPGVLSREPARKLTILDLSIDRSRTAIKGILRRLGMPGTIHIRPFEC